jgi:hypothetical protein
MLKEMNIHEKYQLETKKKRKGMQLKTIQSYAEKR